jgi:hypothetical protein
MEVKGLELFARLAEHLDAEAQELEGAILADSGKDKTRCYRGAVRVEIHQRDGGRCFYCAAPVDIAKMHVDHVIPHVSGGLTVKSNGVCSCRSCNLRKGKRVW